MTQESANSAGPIYRPAPGVLFSAVGQEGVLLSTTEGAYYGLDEVGVAVWSTLSSGADFDTLHRTLLAEFDVSSDVLGSDLRALVDDLISAGLIAAEAKADG